MALRLLLHLCLVVCATTMALSSSAIIDLATPLSTYDPPAQIRTRLEWSWGLGLGHLDDHLLEFDDPQAMLTDETILVFPHSDIIRQLYSRDNTARRGVCRAHIRELYKGLKSFEYLVPTDLESPPRTSNPDLRAPTSLGAMYHIRQDAKSLGKTAAQSLGRQPRFAREAREARASSSTEWSTGDGTAEADGEAAPQLDLV
ncbi:hypothetical protein K438DRAFT_1865501 [Mycena galopus ATCC 62051]|nr:hypothetical protein K438DRAFT_1865501 [Mycena galopus ATCC 62051]